MVMLTIFYKALKLVSLAVSADSYYLGLLLPIFLFTLGYLYARFFLPGFYPRKNHQNPIAPRTLVPFGYIFSLLFSPEGFLRDLLRQASGSPVQLSIPTKKFYLAAPGKQVAWLFKERDLLPAPSLFSAFSVLFGLPAADYKVFEHSHISNFEKTTGSSTTNLDASRRIIEHQRQDFEIYLRGTNLRLILHRFIGNLTRTVLQTDIVNYDWVNLPDLYGFMVSRIFRAEVEALYGKNIFNVCPSFCEDFWAFYEAFPTIAKGLPRWLSRSRYQARERMLRNFQKWRTWCQERCDSNNTDEDNTELHPIWGTEYIRRMVKRHEDLGFTEAGVSTAMLGYLFATVANSIPASIWMLLYIILDQNLTRRVELELIEKGLESCLLNSIYRETLRLRVASAIGRTSPTAAIHAPGGWKFEPDTPIMSSSWLGGLNKSFWNTGQLLPGGAMEHPVDEFWAERFLQYSGDPMSGPVRKPECQEVSRKSTKPNIAKLVTSGLQGNWFPFGGGAYRCPGEALATRTVLSTVEFMLRKLDIQLIDPSEAAKTGSSHRTLPFGSHAFDRPVRFRVRRKLE